MLIIAELGSNFKSLEDCMNACGLAKSAGADAIKFQMYTSQELYGDDETLAGEMPRGWVPELSKECARVGIEFMCTAFSAEGMLYVDPFVRRHKIASCDLGYLDMLRVAKMTQKEILLSAGGATEEEVSDAIEFLGPSFPETLLVLLYCESVYPSRCHDLRKLDALGRLHSRLGYSDHSQDIFCAPLMARSMGALVLEKHYNPFGYEDTPDAPHSLNQHDFSRMCGAIKLKPQLQILSKEEADFRRTAKRKLVATKDIKKGDVFNYGKNYGCFRTRQPMDGLWPNERDNVEGKKALKKVLKGTAITQGSFT